MTTVALRLAMFSCKNDFGLCCNHNSSYFASSRWVKYCIQRVCLSVCPLACVKNHKSKFQEIFCTYCLWPWLGQSIAIAWGVSSGVRIAFAHQNLIASLSADIVQRNMSLSIITLLCRVVAFTWFVTLQKWWHFQRHSYFNIIIFACYYLSYFCLYHSCKTKMISFCCDICLLWENVSDRDV